jgi:hypothetical protein
MDMRNRIQAYQKQNNIKDLSDHYMEMSPHLIPNKAMYRNDVDMGQGPHNRYDEEVNEEEQYYGLERDLPAKKEYKARPMIGSDPSVPMTSQMRPSMHRNPLDDDDSEYNENALDSSF